MIGIVLIAYLISSMLQVYQVCILIGCVNSSWMTSN